MNRTATITPSKFTFDLDLGHNRERARAIPDSTLAQMLNDARREGYTQGFIEGERGATAVAAQSLADAATVLGARATEMISAMDEARGSNLREAVELAASVGRKLAAHLLARHPTAEIEALVTECMATLEGVPHLVIRCHPDLADAVRDLATAQMATSHFTGRLVVMGDPEQRLGDCRIEWVDGGLVRDMNAVSNEINKRIAAFLAARGAGRKQESI